jgi:hypothetical protein
VIDGLTMAVAHGGTEEVLPHVYVPSAQRQISGGLEPPGSGIVIEPGVEWSVIASLSEPLLMQLNGALLNGDSKWVAANPRMTRVLRVDLEYEPRRPRW